MRVPETLHRPYNSSEQKISHSLVYNPFPGLQLQMQLPETSCFTEYCLHCLAPLHFSLLESELPNVTPGNHTVRGCPSYNYSIKIQNSLAQGTGMKEEEEQMENGATSLNFKAM